MAAEGDDGVGGMVTIYCGEAGRYLHRRPFGSKKRSTKSTSRIPTQKSKDASRTQNPAFASYVLLLLASFGGRGKTSKTQIDKRKKKSPNTPSDGRNLRPYALNPL